jgi:hypothetical protein
LQHPAGYLLVYGNSVLKAIISCCQFSTEYGVVVCLGQVKPLKCA